MGRESWQNEAKRTHEEIEVQRQPDRVAPAHLQCRMMSEIRSFNWKINKSRNPYRLLGQYKASDIHLSPAGAPRILSRA